MSDSSHETLETALSSVSSGRRNFLRSMFIGAGALAALAIPTTSLMAEETDTGGKGQGECKGKGKGTGDGTGKGDGAGTGKGDGTGKGKGKGTGKGKGKGKGTGKGTGKGAGNNG